MLCTIFRGICGLYSAKSGPHVKGHTMARLGYACLPSVLCCTPCLGKAPLCANLPLICSNQWWSIRGPIGRSIRGPIWGAIRRSLVGPIRRSIGDPIRGPIRRSIRGPIRQSIGGPIRRSIWGPIRPSIRGPIRPSIRGPIRRSRVDSSHPGRNSTPQPTEENSSSAPQCMHATDNPAGPRLRYDVLLKPLGDWHQ